MAIIYGLIVIILSVVLGEISFRYSKKKEKEHKSKSDEMFSNEYEEKLYSDEIFSDEKSYFEEIFSDEMNKKLK